MIVIVAGGRDYLDRETVFAELDWIDEWLEISRVIEGGQRTFDRETGKCIGGADYHANRWSYVRGIPCTTVRANWMRWGSAAGPIRNQEMLDRFKPGALVHFPGKKGTADMIDRAHRAGVRLIRAGVRAVA